MNILKAPFIFAFALMLGCSAKGTSTGNPLVEVKLDGYTAPLSAKIEPMAISSLTLCFKRLRFKMQGENTAGNPELDEDNIDFEVGEVSITPAGSTLGSVSLPAGTYTRIELDFENQCASGQSIRVANSSGAFQTTSRVTVKFDGTFVADQENEIVLLAIQNLVNALNTVTADSQVRTAAESVSNSF